MKKLGLCGVLLSALLAGCALNTGNTQNVQMQNAAAEAQIEATTVVSEKEDLAADGNAQVQTKTEPGQEDAVAEARNQAAAIAQAEAAAQGQAGSDKTEAAEREQKTEQEPAAAVIKVSKEVQAAVKAVEEIEKETTETATQEEKEKKAQKTEEKKKAQATAKAAEQEAVPAQAAEPAAVPVEAAEPAAVPAQPQPNDAAVVEVSRIYIEDCGLDSGYWEITYSDGHVEYIDN